LRLQARWLVLHRGVRIISWRQARTGNPLARFLFEPGTRADPYPLFNDIRDRGRLVPTPLLHVTADHALVSGVLRDAQNFSVALGEGDGMPAIVRWAFDAPDPEIASVVDAPSLLAVDPPTHTRYRRLVTKPFTPRALQQVADRVEERAAELLEGLAGRREVDIVAEYANLLPVAVIAEILGVPENMHEQFLAWGHAAAPVLDLGLSHREYTAVNRSLKAMNLWFNEHFANLRRKPGEDILSKLVNADPAERLTDLELRATALLLLGAGFETTVNLLGSGIAVLGPDEKSRARLVSDPELWPQAVEELLRFESPVQLTGRVATTDIDIDGVGIAKGTPVLSLLGGANRDPAVFANPDVFDLDRPNSRDHVAFSAGIHYCLGANLAKMEGQTGLRMLFERFPDLRVLPGTGRRRDLQALRGYESLWVDLND
jgi:hypothetical protein